MPTTGEFRRIDPAEPWKLALPKTNMPPSAATVRYPVEQGAGPATPVPVRWALCSNCGQGAEVGVGMSETYTVSRKALTSTEPPPSLPTATAFLLLPPA